MFAAVLIAAATLVPIHGTVLDAHGTMAVVRTEPVTLTLPEATRRYRLDRPLAVPAGTQIDAYVDRTTQPWTLRSPQAAAAFAPGMPDVAHATPVDDGSALPAAELVDQNGRLRHLESDFSGKTLLLSFVFTRCPDRTLCPAISGKYAYLQSRLDARRFALAEITLDPQYDSPAVLAAYGARYGADPRIWTLLTGKGSTIQQLLDAFRIDSLRLSTSNFLHNDKLYIVTPAGRIASIVDSGEWDPQAVLAEARAVGGLSSNPFERFKLSLIAGVAAFCGGSQFAGVVVLELTLFLLIVLVVVAVLWAVARVLWPKAPA